jgi:uncharacterized protein
MRTEPREWPNRLDVVLKLAERCNLACPYCYYFFKENDLHKSGPALIPESTVRDLAAFLRRGVEELDIEHLYIGLHGGEPLLLPRPRFDALCRILRDELGEITNVHFGLQTNGTLVSEEWIELFSRYQVMVGVSIDGPPHIHDAARPDHRGRGSYEATVRGLRLLQEAARTGRTQATGVLCVANPDYSGEEVVRHFVEDLGIRNLNLLLPREGYDSDIWKPQSKWIRYFDEVIRYWQTTASKERPVMIYILSDIMTALASEASARRLDYLRSNRHNIITITADGHLGPDDNIMALDKALCSTEVTIRNTSLAQFFASPMWQQMVQSLDAPPERCRSCEWYRTCRSGELYNRYQKGLGFSQRSAFCETLDSIHTRLAGMVARRDGGLERLTQILGSPPEFRAGDFLQVGREAPARVEAPAELAP